MSTTLPAFFVQPPQSPPDAPENIAVNIVKCSGICKSGAHINSKARRQSKRFAIIYFRGCGVTWFFANNSHRDEWYKKLLSNEWTELEPYKHQKRNAQDTRQAQTR